MRNPPCCMPLQKATKIIAIIQMVMLSMCLLALTVSLVVVALNYQPLPIPSTLSTNPDLDVFGLKMNYSWTHAHDHDAPTDDLTIVHNNATYYHEKLFVSVLLSQIMSYLVVCLIFCVVYLIIVFHLLKGAIERNHWRCMPWFHCEVIGTVVGLILAPFVIILMVPQMMFVLLITCLVQLAVKGYMIWVVYAFMKEAEEDEKNGKPEAEEFIKT